MEVIGRVIFDLPQQQGQTQTATPKLTENQKIQIKNLMTEYLENKGKFVYDGSFRRESYAYAKSVSSLSADIQGCMYKGKYILNCGLFAQMIWLGRKLSDFTTTPRTSITTDFDWGYYFDFRASKKAYGIMKTSTKYYEGNTYENDYGDRKFITFDNAAAMGQELYQLGFEIPYSDIEIGDLVFYRSSNISDGDTDGLEQSSFRCITHVGIVYDVKDHIPTIIESSSAYTAAIGKCGLNNDVTKFGNMRASGLEQRVVMAARHPSAYGKGGNVPAMFTKYRGTEVQK